VALVSAADSNTSAAKIGSVAATSTGSMIEGSAASTAAAASATMTAAPSEAKAVKGSGAMVAVASVATAAIGTTAVEDHMAMIVAIVAVIMADIAKQR